VLVAINKFALTIRFTIRI